MIRWSQIVQRFHSGFVGTDTEVPIGEFILTLPVGNYAAVVRGKNGSTGVALVEVYRPLI
jgi:hypothetical protein